MRSNDTLIEKIKNNHFDCTFLIDMISIYDNVLECGGNVALTFTKDNAMHSENDKKQIGRWLIDNGIDENDILDNPQVRAIYKDKVYVSKYKPHRKPKSLAVHWFVNDQIFGCKFSNPKIGVMINEYGNLTTDPKMVSCGICRSIMTSAIKQNK